MIRLLSTLSAVLLMTMLVSVNLLADDRKSEVPVPDGKKTQPAKQPAKQPVRVFIGPRVVPAGPNMRVTRQPTTLLRNTQIQQELKLDDEQKDSIANIYKEQNAKRSEQFQAIRGLQGDERTKKIAEWRKQMETAGKETQQQLRKLLKPQQQTRLDQIALQMQGQRAWQDPAIIKKLKITDQQQQQFQEIEEATTEKRKQLFQDLRAGNLDRTKYSDQLKQISKQQETKSKNVLNKEQQERFQQLKGEQFELRAQLIRRGPVAVPANGGQPRKIQLQPRPQGKQQKLPLQPQKIKAR